jgi:putative transcription factor
MCDMCSSPETVYRIEVEGSMMNVCEKCASFGRMIGKIRQEVPEKKIKKQIKAARRSAGAEAEVKAGKEKTSETMQIINQDYSALIQKARQKLGLKQEELAKKLAEKESVIHKLESGIIKPDLNLARKLEKFLRIRIVEEVEIDDSVADEGSKGSASLTLGDLIKI